MTLPVTKSYVDANNAGLTFLTAKPANPVAGDTYFNETDGCVYMWAASQWMLFASNGTKPLVTMEELVDMYPDLKALVDKYMTFEILKRTGQ